MIRAKHSKWFGKLFNIYLLLVYRLYFNKLEIKGHVNDLMLPILVVANHVSWWDGFWVLRINQKLWKRQLFVMMLECQLQKNMFLCRLGAFSIKKRSRTMRSSIEYAANILKDGGKLLLLFPQGQIHSQYTSPMKFQKGWYRIVELAGNPVQVVMVANLTDYLASPKPSLTQYIFSPGIAQDYSPDQLEAIYNDFYRKCVDQQTDLPWLP